MLIVLIGYGGGAYRDEIGPVGFLYKLSNGACGCGGRRDGNGNGNGADGYVHCGSEGWEVRFEN